MRRDSSTILAALRAPRRLSLPLSQRETHLPLRAEVAEGSNKCFDMYYVPTLNCISVHYYTRAEPTCELT